MQLFNRSSFERHKEVLLQLSNIKRKTQLPAEVQIANQITYTE
jgi:hypothetical protein